MRAMRPLHAAFYAEVCGMAPALHFVHCLYLQLDFFFRSFAREARAPLGPAHRGLFGPCSGQVPPRATALLISLVKAAKALRGRNLPRICHNYVQMARADGASSLTTRPTRSFFLPAYLNFRAQPERCKLHEADAKGSCHKKNESEKKNDENIKG